MNAIERLDRYLNTLRQRLRARTLARGALLCALMLLVLVVGFSAWLVRSSNASLVATARVAVVVALGTICVAAVLVPLHVLRRHDARIFERYLPEQQGRLATYLDTLRRRGAHAPLLELLAEDALRVAQHRPLESIVPARRIRLHLMGAILALAALIAFVAIAPGSWGLASRHLLLGAELPAAVVPMRAITVTPGDTTVRRNSDLAIRAVATGFEPERVALMVRFADQEVWEQAPMQPDGARAFTFKLYALRSPLEYYVDADGTRSAVHRVTLVDVPRIERVRLTYHYPEWTGLDPEVDEESPDIRAVAGTKVTVEIQTDVPLADAVLVHDERAAPLASEGTISSGTLSIEKPGRYHLAATVAGERVVLSDDYSVEIVPDEKPVVQIERPGRDWRATSIEEVPVRVRAYDDFRLQSVELRYSVNGGEWRSIPLDRAVKETRRAVLLDLEALGAQEASEAPLLAPGDLISYYAVAKDHKRTVETDLFMIQVQPFERRFFQQSAGGGAMADEQGEISARQREILLATWNLQRSAAERRQSRAQLKDNAAMLAEMQATLAKQARTLATRTRARAQVESDERVRTFVESLERAALAMDPAAAHLSAFELEKAVPPEQQALQQLLRAEAAFREVQVAMQRESGAEGAQAARDFGEMFELEMDVEKSQYETESQLAENTITKEMQEALRKLKELAQRQEELAQEARRNTQPTPEQRWRQEQLRREAEDLRRRLAALDRQQRSQQGEQSRSDRGSQSGGAQGSSGNQAQSETQRALESVDEALAKMQAANMTQGGASTEPMDSAREASEKLRDAIRQLDRPRAAGLDKALEQLADRAGELASEQQRIEADLYDAVRESGQSAPFNSPRRGSIDPERAQALVESKQQLAEQLAQLQRELRESVHGYRDTDSRVRRQLADIVNNVEASDLMYRLRRSAAEIYYGRARDAAAREGIITESLQNLEKSLREAAIRVAKGSGQSQQEEPAAERLLAEVAELRRRLQQSERLQAAQDSPGSTTSERESSQPRSEPGEGREPTDEGEGSVPGPSSGSEQTGREALVEAVGQNGAERSLSGWDPILPHRPLRDVNAPGRDSLIRQSEAIAERARRLRERADHRELSDAELAQLRKLTRELRQLAGDPLAVEAVVMRRAIEQLELAAFAAAANARRTESARASLPLGDSPQYRETVAEYYRRLGGV